MSLPTVGADRLGHRAARGHPVHPGARRGASGGEGVGGRL